MDLKDTEQSIFGVPVWGTILKSENYHAINYEEYLSEVVGNRLSRNETNFLIPEINFSEVGVFREFFGVVKQLVDNFGHSVVSEKCELLDTWSEIGYERKLGSGIHNDKTDIKALFFINEPNKSLKFQFKNPLQVKSDYFIKPEDHLLNAVKTGFIFYPAWLDYYYHINTPFENETPLMTINFNIGVCND